MEETKEKNEQEPKLTYEQLEKVALQLQQRLVAAERAIGNIDIASIRLKWLFKVLEHQSLFPHTFVNKCVEEIKNILNIDRKNPNKVAEKAN